MSKLAVSRGKRQYHKERDGRFLSRRVHDLFFQSFGVSDTSEIEYKNALEIIRRRFLPDVCSRAA